MVKRASVLSFTVTLSCLMEVILWGRGLAIMKPEYMREKIEGEYFMMSTEGPNDNASYFLEITIHLR